MYIIYISNLVLKAFLIPCKILLSLKIYFVRKLEYTRDTLLAFKKEMEMKQKEAKGGGGGFGGFGGFGGNAGDTAKDKVHAYGKKWLSIHPLYGK